MSAADSAGTEASDARTAAAERRAEASGARTAAAERRAEASGARTALSAEPAVITGGENLWFLGTLAKLKLESRQTGGRFGMWEGVLPRGAAPPLHSHPQDETFYLLEGELTGWLVEIELAEDRSDPPAWVSSRGRRCGPGTVLFAPGGTPHTFRVESETARLLVLSTPAGIEDMMRALSEPARWPWLPPPPDGPRVPPERMAEVERRTGMVRHGPPPPRA